MQAYWCFSNLLGLVSVRTCLSLLYTENIFGQNRRLRSVLQGVTCKMIDKVADSDVQDMAQAITETPQWLSKVQVCIYSYIQYVHTRT